MAVACLRDRPQAIDLSAEWPVTPLSRSMFVMCIICVDFARGALKVDEAKRALREMVTTLDPKHALQLAEKLDEAEEPKAPSAP
jgi:hypothetical protein